MIAKSVVPQNDSTAVGAPVNIVTAGNAQHLTTTPAFSA